MIEQWIEQFQKGWMQQDISSVMDLFAEDLEYWETPFQKITSKTELYNEWQAIKQQSRINVVTTVLATTGHSSTVKWHLTYRTVNGEICEWAGLYIVKLRADGRCIYFYKVGESKR